MRGGTINKYIIRIVILCGILVIFDGYDTAIMGLCLTSIKADLQIDSIVAGYLGSASIFGIFFGAIICGVLADKIGRRKVLIMSLLIFSVFTGLNGIAVSVPYFFIMRFLTGLGLGGIYPAAFAIVSEYAPPGRRALTVVLVGVGMEIGKILAVIVALFTIPILGWRIVFAICLLPLITIPFLVRDLPETLPLLLKRKDHAHIKKILHAVNPSYVPQTDDVLVYHSEFCEAVKSGSFSELFTKGRARNTICFILLYCSVVFIGYACLTWLPDLMVTAGYSMATGHVSQLALQTGTLIAALVFGLVADTFGFRRTLSCMYAIGFLAVLVLGLTTGCGVGVTLAILVVVGACACDQNLNHAYISASYPINLRGTILGWGLGLARVPGVFAPILLGHLSQAHTPLSVIFLILAVVPLISFCCVLISRDTVSTTNRNVSEMTKSA